MVNMLIKHQSQGADRACSRPHNERRGNPYTTWEAAAGISTSLYTGKSKELPLFTPAT